MGEVVVWSIVAGVPLTLILVTGITMLVEHRRHAR
jgi:hypothetical protein